MLMRSFDIKKNAEGLGSSENGAKRMGMGIYFLIMGGINQAPALL
jgi:hypothetical protein